jgi:hypothetical protein
MSIPCSRSTFSLKTRINVANGGDHLDLGNLGCRYLHAGLIAVNVSKFPYTNLSEEEKGADRISLADLAEIYPRPHDLADWRGSDPYRAGALRNRCRIAARSSFGGCPQRPTAVEDGRYAGRFLIEDFGSGDLVMIEWLTPLVTGCTPARWHAICPPWSPHAPGSALCVTLRDSFRQ